ncbi:ABC transporter permease [candidate division KSB1 bacterium]
MWRNPPRIAEKIIEYTSLKDDSHSICGDLVETYQQKIEDKGLAKAYLWYWSQAIISLPIIIFHSIYCNIIMISNNLKITFRTLRKYKGFSIINIIGFALSMSICLMIIIFFKDQKNSDRFHDKKDRIVRVYTTDTEESWDVSGSATTPGFLGPYLMDNYPFIENSVRIKKLWGAVLKDYTEIPLSGLYVEPSFFKIFTYPLKYGNPETALSEPYSIIISEETALRFFGSNDPINETIVFNNIGEYKVTGVFRETVNKSHFKFDVLASFSTVIPLLNNNIFSENHAINNWSSPNKYYTYVLLRNADDFSLFEDQLPQMEQSIIPESEKVRFGFKLQPLLDINMGMILHENMPGTRHILDLLFLPFIGVFLIALSCLNYIILSVARSLKRTKEIGLRKVIGARRRDIIKLFLCESTVITLIALVTACFLLLWLIPAVNNIDEVENNQLYINFEMMKDPGLYVFFVLFAITVGLLAGLYPALHLSLVRSVSSLRGGSWKPGFRRLLSRKVLMSIQFAISLMSIIFIVYSYQLTEYWLSFDIGIATENTVSLGLQDVNHEVLKYEISTDSNVTSVSFSDNVPIYGGRNYAPLAAENSDDFKNTCFYFIDPEFIEDFELELVSGRNFLKDIYTDVGRSVIINEEAVIELQLGSIYEAIGKTLIMNEQDECFVIGVVKDFNFRTLENNIEPMAFLTDPAKYRYANIKYVQGKKEEVKTSFANIWKKLDKFDQADFMFFEDIREDMENQIQEIMNLASLACGYIIFVALCGLLGMSMYTTELRTREISIRKVLGSSIPGAVYLLSKDYIKLILFSSAFALPCAYFLTSTVMQYIAHRPGLSLWVPPLTLLFVLTLALLTISSQTINVALTNPVETLREE